MFIIMLGTTIGIFMAAIGIGWLWANTAQWRELRKQSRWCDRHLQTTWRVRLQFWLIDFKWTAIQLYQKFIQWCHKK